MGNLNQEVFKMARKTDEEREMILSAFDNQTTKSIIKNTKLKVEKALYEDKLLDKATELICESVKKIFDIYTTREDSKSEMWIYRGGIYIPKGRTYVREFARKIFGRTYTDKRANLVIHKLEVDTYIDSDIFFGENNIDEIPVLNGILNLKTLELSDFSPDKIFFSKINARYDPVAECPNIDKFITEILKKPEDKNIVYEIIGSGLRREYTIEKAVMCVGKGRNGKSKLLELMKRFVGHDNCCAIPLSEMKSGSSAVCELHKRLFNLGGDLSNTDLKDTGLLKQSIGRDILQAKRKFLTDLNFINYAKHVFAANELPRVYDMTDGFWTKWILLEFPYKFVTKKEKRHSKSKVNLKEIDPHIIDKITTEEELSGLLNKALEGLKRILENKDFSYTIGTSQIKDAWIRMSDSFKSFCLDRIEESYSEIISKEDLRKQYLYYCLEHKVKGASEISIKITLEDLYGVTSAKRTIGNNRPYCWVGIKYKTNKVKVK